MKGSGHAQPSCSDADVTVSSERRVERVSSREQEAERPDDVYGQAAGRVAGDRGGRR